MLLGCVFSTAHSRMYFSASYLNNKTMRATFPFPSGSYQQCLLRMAVTTVRNSCHVKPGHKHFIDAPQWQNLLKGGINNSKIDTIKMKGGCLASFEEGRQRNDASCPKGQFLY